MNGPKKTASVPYVLKLGERRFFPGGGFTVTGSDPTGPTGGSVGNGDQFKG
jgi:hypothetical protein